MATEKTEALEEKVIDISDFFTTDNEDKGMWFEPVIDGSKTGIEFQVIGANSDKNAVSAERYNKKLAEINAIKDPAEASAKRKELEADRIADLVVGVRSKPGTTVVVNKKPLEYSREVIVLLMRKSPMMAQAIFNFAYKTSNFMKKNNSN